MTAQFPDKLACLFEPARYKVAYGGRGGAKSHSFAKALVLIGAREPKRILCARETMKSLAESVHQLLEDQINSLGLAGFYTTQQTKIIGANGTEIAFAGLRHNVSEIKSYEGADIVWVEEAANVSKHSWDTLIPTIRKPGSEIWVSFNPVLETDDTYRRFIVKPDPRARVVKIDWSDNPWFPQVLRDEMEHCRATDPDAYHHVWGGNCISVLEGAIYANELRRVDAEQRITRVPYDATKPVHTFWDIGYGDHCAVWFAQTGAFDYRLIDYLESNQRGLDWYLQQLQAKGYTYGTHWLPWDAQPKHFGTGKSVQELMREKGFNCSIVPKLSVADGINAARALFGSCWFDAEKCADGIQALRHYRYGIVKTLNAPTREPIHDVYSHGSDAFRYLAVGIKAPAPKRPDTDAFLNGFGPYGGGPGGWMA
jgi:phage terminase large subunit